MDTLYDGASIEGVQVLWRGERTIWQESSTKAYIMMSDAVPCPFCAPGERILLRRGSAFAIPDEFAVSPGHTLVVPFRHAATYFDATDDEKRDLWALVEEVKEFLDERYHPDGYNVGTNCGEAAGQTIFHLHVHVIPRYEGDTPNPRGGVRHVIPGKGDYQKSPRMP
jgi:diadenosine tetraphosphate (Ap4A) HIT family hydrolase